MKRSLAIGDRSYQITSDDAYLANMGPAYEPDMVALFRALITPEMTVADIGANIGMTSLLFSALAGRVYAFEPAPSTFALLEANLTAASATNVERFNIGLGDLAQEMTLTYSTNDRSGGFVSGQVRPDRGHVTETIRVETLDGFFADRHPRPDFIKIDVEGFEPNVIRGGAGLLWSTRPTVVLELNHFCLNVLQRVALPDFFDQLRRVFPVLLAMDKGNRGVANLHDPDSAYSVMHSHVTRFAFPNIVGSFDRAVPGKLHALVSSAQSTE